MTTAAVAGVETGPAKRHLVVAMCAFSVSLCYIDRVNISVAIIPMAEHYRWSATTKGFVLSSFFIGYLLAVIPTGWLANRYGGRRLMGAALIAWSTFTILTPVTATISFATLIVTRAAMGAGESASFPAAYNLFARWVPPAERSRTAAINFTGISAGTIVALLTTGWLVERWGWPSAFYVFGGLGIAFALLWFAIVPRTPDAARAATTFPPAAIPWRRLLAHRAVWALVVNHFCSNWTLYLMLTWLPSYFRDVQHLSIAGSGLFAILPWVSQFVGGNLAAWLADRAIARGTPVTRVRKWTQCVSVLGSAACFLLASQAVAPLPALAAMCGALGFGGMCWAGFACNHLDLAPRHADVLWSISNTAGTLPGVIGVAATGLLLDWTGGYTATFLLAAAVNLVGAAVWLAWATGGPIVD